MMKTMRRSRLVVVGGLVAVLALAYAAPLAAHHAFGAEFDRDAPIRLQGKIVRLEWVNPHTWIHLEVTEDDGSKTQWMVEGGTPNTLLRRGLTKQWTDRIGKLNRPAKINTIDDENQDDR